VGNAPKQEVAMTDGQEIWLWIGFAGMVLGTLAIAAIGRRTAKVERHHAVASCFVTMLAALSYFAMANGQLVREVDGRTVYVARYVDWAFTTPLLLLGLMMLALPPLVSSQSTDSRSRLALVGGVIGADVLMILTGLFASLSENDTTRYVWYVISCGFFLAVLALIAGPVRAEGRAAGTATFALFQRLAVVLAVLWFIYPVLWLLGTEGLSVIGLTAEVAVFAIIDLSAKVVFGIMLVSGVASLTHGREERPVESRGQASPRREPATV
jgi:bacteriorhodopsin